MDELLQQFLIEAPELVQQATDDLLELERDPANALRIDSAFRAVHTLKASVALFDFAPMAAALHAAEDLLGAIRMGRVQASRKIVTVLMDCIGACDSWVASIADCETLPRGAEALALQITAALREALGSAALASAEGTKSELSAAASLPLDISESGRDTTARMLRVDTGRIDVLVDVLGELIVAKNALAHLATKAADLDARFARDLGANQADIDRLVGVMHRAIMHMRMVPLARTFQRFPRLVRELAERLGKNVSFEVKGEAVEADKSIVDGLFGPLLHVLRNAVDHGIENKVVREKGGKVATGRISLEAVRAGDQIVVTVSDDGSGIESAKIREVAKARGLRSGTAIDAMDDAAATDLIFTPGFSTANAVSDVSGRGVGMDAARTAVETLGGRIAVSSTRGMGTSVQLTLPQAVVITTIMIVTVGDERFGVPIEAVVETARIPVARIQPIRSGAAFVLRDRTIPLLGLAALLHLPSAPRIAADAKVLIAWAGEHLVGIEVDSFAERTDTLLRPMTGLLAGMPGILGSALLGDGSVLMILNLAELVG